MSSTITELVLIVIKKGGRRIQWHSRSQAHASSTGFNSRETN